LRKQAADLVELATPGLEVRVVPDLQVLADLAQMALVAPDLKE
jgi:hypothetical protein